MRHVHWLPLAYEVTARFIPAQRGRSNIYLVLLDYSDSRADPYGVYVGMSRYSPDAAIRAAQGRHPRRGQRAAAWLEVLTGPTLHLQRIARTEAVRIEEELAEALRAQACSCRAGTDAQTHTYRHASH